MAIIDDVVTTGNSLIRAAEYCRDTAGLKVALTMCILLREDRARQALTSLGYQHLSLLTLSDLAPLLA